MKISEEPLELLISDVMRSEPDSIAGRAFREELSRRKTAWSVADLITRLETALEIRDRATAEAAARELKAMGVKVQLPAERRLILLANKMTVGPSAGFRRRLENGAEVEKLMAALTYRQRAIVKARIVEKLSWTQIARRYRVTRERVRCLWTKALVRIKANGEERMKRDDESMTEATPAPLAVDSRGAARLLSLSARTIFSLTKRGELPSFMVGRRRLYSVVALATWVDEQITGPLAADVRILGLSVRSRNALRGGGIKTVGDLVQCSPRALCRFRNCGKACLTEVVRSLGEIGLHLRDAGGQG